jgi:hypothetical protein
VASSLSRIPIAKRRQLAATLGLFAVLFIAIAAVAGTGPATGVNRAFLIVALLVAVLLALTGWGVLQSVKADLDEERLDAAIADAVASRGRSLCTCGHEHDPNELHVVDEEPACAEDGLGHGCAHSCETCVLATLRSTPARPSPRPVAEPGTRPRPRPTPAGRA